jgi:hypothetical protein
MEGNMIINSLMAKRLGDQHIARMLRESEQTRIAQTAVRASGSPNLAGVILRGLEEFLRKIFDRSADSGGESIALSGKQSGKAI